MPEKGVETLTQPSQQGILQTHFIDCHGEPTNLPPAPLDLTTEPIGEKLVSQTDTEDRHVGLQSLHNPLPLCLEERLLEFLGPVLATSKDHSVIVPQIWDGFAQIYPDLGRQNPKSLEDVIYDKGPGRTVNEGDDP